MWRELRVALAAAIAALALSGCSFLSKVVESEYALAAKTDEACAVVDDTFVPPQTDEELKKQLVSRLRIRLTGVVCDDDCPNADASFRRARFDAVIERARQRIQRERGDLRDGLDRIKASLDSIKKSFAAIDKSFAAADDALKAVKVGDCTSRQACARKLLFAFGGVARHLDAAREGSEYNKIQREIAKIAAEARDIVAALQRDYPDLAEALEIAVYDAQAILQRARQALSLFVAQDVPSLAQTFFITNIKYEFAERALRWFETGLKRVDRIIDKADDRFFLLPTLVVTAGGSGIQSAFDDFYDRFLKKELRRLDIELSFAKVACDKLRSADVQSSQLMPFVNRMFATVFFRHRKDEKLPPVADSEEVNLSKVVGYVRVQSALAGLPKVNVAATTGAPPAGVMAAPMSAETRPPLTDLSAYEYCYLAEIASATDLRRESGGRGSGEKAMSRDLGARVCGALVATLQPVPAAGAPAGAGASPGGSGDLRAAMQTYVRQIR